MQAFFTSDPIFKKQISEKSVQFDNWLDQNLSDNITSAERKQILTDWRKAPGSFDCHPYDKDEHFVPLLVVVGSALDT